MIRNAFYPHPQAPGSPRKSPPSVGGRPKMREGELASSELAIGDESPSLLVGEGFGVGGEKALKDRTLTNLYNALQVLANATR